MGKSKAYSKIIDYLENEDPDFATAMKNCCVENMLNTRRKPGVTLLRPVNKEFRNRLLDMSQGDLEEKKEAIMLIAALIIPLNLKSVDDFAINKSIIHNGNKQIIEITGIKSGSVNFANGSKASKDINFVDGSKENNINVYKFDGNNGLPIDAPSADNIERASGAKRRGKVDGGYDIEQRRAAHDIRFAISTQVENIFSSDKIAGKTTNAFIEYAYNLCSFIIERGGSDVKDIFIERMLPYVSYQEIDFYFFIEPHADHPTDDYLIPTHIITEWWRQPRKFNFHKVYAQIDDILASQNKKEFALLNSSNSRIKILEETDSLRGDIIDNKNIKIADDIISQYKRMSAENSIGHIKHVWPTVLAAKYKDNPYRKLFEDELRYITYKCFRRYDKGNFVRDSYADLLGMIGNYMHQKPSENSMRLINSRRISQTVDASAGISEIISFVQSTSYIFIPLTKKECQHLNEKLFGQTDRPDITSNENIWNITLDMHEKMGTLIGDKNTKNPENKKLVVEMLKRMRNGEKVELEPEMKEELDRYLNSKK